MIENIKIRVEELIQQGNNYLGKVGYYEGKPDYWFNTLLVPELQKWIASVITIINHSANKDSYFFKETAKIANDEDLKKNVPYHSVQKLTGLLSSFKEELELGFLDNLELKIISLAYDNFLDHAAEFHSANKNIESSILASIVLEDTIRKIADENEIAQDRKSIEDIINELIKLEIFTSVQGKRIKSYAALRNEALHTHWDKCDIREIGLMINGTRELIETKLDS